VDSCEHDKESLGSINGGEILDYQLFKAFVSWTLELIK
jgi:hypothetical protein